MGWGDTIYPWHRADRRSNSPRLNTRFIVNPRSGAARRALPAVRAFAALHGARVVPTERARHASELARQAVDEGCELVVAVGGDGTMNEIASQLLHSPVTLGLVPCGSGDGLGRHLGIHGSTAHALAILQHGRPALIDSGLADGHPFFTAAGIGFEAEIADRFNRLTKRGFARYLTTSALLLRQWEPSNCTITSHERDRAAPTRETLRAFTLAVANAAQYGNGALIAPRARLDDGLLDLTVVPPVRWSNALPFAARLFHGSLERAAGVRLLRGARFVVERATAGLLHTDGEVHAAGPRIEFVVQPASLRIMAPA